MSSGHFERFAPAAIKGLAPASAGPEPAVAAAGATGGFRGIRLDRHRILIERCVAGVKMLLSLPVSAFDGPVLSLAQTADRSLYGVELVHRDPALSVRLHETRDASEALAIWRAWKDFFAKPAESAKPPRQMPLVATATGACPHRRGASLPARRPRFRKRRGCAPLAASVCTRQA